MCDAILAYRQCAFPSSTRLSAPQSELDFVDVDVARDTPLFIDPLAIRQLPDDWGHECVAYIQDFFATVLDAIRRGKNTQARVLLRGLREPNETRLGLSSARPRGRALGPESARDVWNALAQSQAAQSGLLVDLEDTILLVRGIGPDIVSDIGTNLIRMPLIRYTQEMCDRYGIPMLDQVYSGPLWNPETKAWEEGGYVQLPIAGGRRLVLTPKAIVRRRMDYNAKEYYRDFIIPFLEQEEIKAGSSLVRVLKKRRVRYVTKKDLVAKYGADKDAIVRITAQNPRLLQRYKQQKATTPTRPLDHADMVEVTGSEPPNWNKLLADVVSVPKSNEHADDYHDAIERLLSALFSNSLIMPRKETPLHAGRKRIDITYVNAGQRDFFDWVKSNYPAGHIIIECKNYTGDPANPELDQLSGRFSPSRGMLGLLTCRTFKNKQLFLERCRDTARDDRGFIIPLDDDDLALLTKYRGAGQIQAIYEFFMKRFRYLLDMGDRRR